MDQARCPSRQGKVVYATVAEAMEVAKRMGGKLPAHVYVCRYCGMYHITTRGKNSRRRPTGRSRRNR